MNPPPFLSRNTLGLPNYFLIALAVVLVMALIPLAARKAHQSNSNRAEDWLPTDYPESADLRWFRKYFFSEGYVVVSWDGCTLGNTEKLNLLAAKLSARIDAAAAAKHDRDATDLPETARGTPGKWFRKIVTGPSLIEELTEPPLSLGFADAVRRLEGVLVGPPDRDVEGRPLGDETRTTCLVAYLAPDGYRNNRQLRRVVDFVTEVAQTECGIPAPKFHMGGPPVDNVAIDKAGESSLVRLASLSGLVGLAITFWCFRNMALTGVVVAVGAVSMAMSLAIVYYYGVLEVWLGGYASPYFGKMDAVLMTMPAVVYVLGLSGAIHMVNYYRDTRREFGLYGAAERASRIAWMPCAMAAFTTAVGLGSLVASDIVPIKKFGGFTAVAVLATIGVLFTVLPVYLHRFPPKLKIDESRNASTLPPWAFQFARFVTRNHGKLTVAIILLAVVVGIGLTRIQSSVQLLKLLDDESDLIADYTWLEEHMGNLVPMEVVITVPTERCRSGDEHAERDGDQYRLTMFERMAMIRRILDRIESLEEVSRTLSASTFAPESSQNISAALRRGNDYTINENLEENRRLFRDYLRVEKTGTDDPGRELWRISARVTALKDIDYGHFVDHLRSKVEPILMAYRQRDRLVRQLHEKGQQLEGARVCILFRGDTETSKPDDASTEGLLADLLRQGGIKHRVEDRQGNLVFVNLALLDVPEVTDEKRAEVIAALLEQDAVVVASRDVLPADSRLADSDLEIIDLSGLSAIPGSAANKLAASDAPRPMRAVYTGIIPLVFKTQHQLLVSLRVSIFWAAVMIAIVMAFVLRSLSAGLVSMIPNIFPIVVVFGALGWLGVKVEIGIMMTASVALGVAVDGTIHYLTWFRRGVRHGLDRADASLLAYERCAAAMTQTSLIAGLGILVFATSTFRPTQQFGYLMVTMLAGALVGDLVLLPGLLCGPLGRCFVSRLDVKTGKEALAGDLPYDIASSQVVGGAPSTPNRDYVSSESLETSDESPVGAQEAAEQEIAPSNENDQTAPAAESTAELREKLRKFRRESRQDSLRS